MINSVKGSKQLEWRKSQGLKRSVVLKAASRIRMEKEPGSEAVSSVKGSKQSEWRKSQGLKQTAVLKAASSRNGERARV